MDDPEMRRKYKKCKYVVKMWEKDFQRKHGTIPSKYDIHDAPRKIRDAYKLYFQLKKTLFEETASDIFSEDGFDPSLEISQDTSNASQHLPELPDMTQPLNVWGDEVSNKTVKTEERRKVSPPMLSLKTSLSAKLFSTGSFSKRNPRKSLSRTTSLPGKTISNLSFSSDAGKTVLPDLETILNEKSAQKASDPISTPKSIKDRTITNNLDRGWLNRHLSDSSLCGFNTVETPTTSASKFGLSNISAELFRHASSPAPVSDLSPVNEVKTVSLCNLSSNTQSPNSVTESKPSSVVTSPNGVLTSTENLKVPQPDNNNDSDSVIENSEDESPKRRFEIIRPALKRRKVEIENEDSCAPIVKSVPTKVATVEEDARPEDSPESPPKIKQKRKTVRKAKTNKEDSDDTEDETYELKPKAKKKASQKANARKSKKTVKAESKPKTAKTGNLRKNPKRVAKSNTILPEEPSEDIAPDCIAFAVDTKQLTCLPSVNIKELDEAEQVVKRYISDIKEPSDSKMAIKKDPDPQLREISARDNLAAKVASGRANENFVRINLKKKVYARGKKHMTYSKYKKNIWKQKKAAALCGPEMDMRGCDGGILSCFKCGLPGHFAQRCPNKGDNLLSLESVEVDESPFPTLDEAEEMAKEKALAVHSKNIENLPPSLNKMIYRFSSEKENINKEVSDTETVDNDMDDEIMEPEVPNPPENHQVPTYIGHKIPQEFLEKAGLLENSNSNFEKGPLYQLKPNGEVIEPTKEVYDVLKMFGHKSFRKGQEKAIMRILSGVSTLVTLSTGSGKSLCYQLPAYLYSKKRKCITLVVSPLVSLMEDQVHGVPAFLNAQCLHTNQTPTQRQNVLEMIHRNEVDVLLVSPEAIVAGERSTGFGSILRSLPPVAFACIDEVHCVSQWSHNFRPSYLMICKVLKTKLGVRTILGLTATATFQTRESIIQHLNIPDGVDGIITDIPLPDNLFLSASKDEQRDYALVELLRSPRFAELQSIIVYCTRREECERVAGFIRTCFQDTRSTNSNTGKRKRINWCAEPYHAGMAASRRRTIQKAFMQNDLRIVVATVAFGMGINKADIRAVIHYNMPKTFESYVQEVGRAGRDGLPSHCHLFLDSKGSDQNELRRHIYANSIDRHVIRKLLQKVFVSCSCTKNIEKKEFVDEYAKEIEAVQMIDWDDDFSRETKTVRQRICPGHEIGIPVEKTVELLDIPQENISTLLCYLELDGRWSLRTLSNAYIMCKIISYGGPTQIKKAAKECPPLAMAIALEIKKGKFDETANIFEFSVIEIASAIGWNSGVVKYQLKNLEWTTVNDLPKRSTLTVNFYEVGFRIQSPGDFTDDELDEALDVLYNRSVHQEKTQLAQLQHVFEGLSSVAYNSYAQCAQSGWSGEPSERLKNIIRDYFKQDIALSVKPAEKIDTSHDDLIIHNVRDMINMYPENNFTGRSLARIFHGIQSPNYPALMWSRCKYWRAHFKIDFNHIVSLANAVIVQMRR